MRPKIQKQSVLKDLKVTLNCGSNYLRLLRQINSIATHLRHTFSDEWNSGNQLATNLIYGLILISYSDNFIKSECAPLVKLVVLNKNYPK